MTEGEKCGLSSILPMSCRGRAEAFARSLHSKLRSLGSQDDNGSADESSWLAANENPVAISQPRHASDTDMYFEYGLLESPGSPEEEIVDNELEKLINKDTLKHSHSDECHCKKAKAKKSNVLNSVRSSSNDSDSDGPFYDTENFSEDRISCNGENHSESSKSIETGIDVNSEDITSNQDEMYETSSDCTQQRNTTESLSDDASTISLRDDEFPLDMNGSLTDVSKFTSGSSSNSNEFLKLNGDVTSPEDAEVYVSHLNIEKDLTVECENSQKTVAEITITDESSQTETSPNQSFDTTIVDNSQPHERLTSTLQITLEPRNGATNEEDLENEDRVPRVRRCSSLKTEKTPPGTPGRKKIVRFADAMGLDLADVRTFLDEIPKVPISAYEDLSVDMNEPSSDNSLINDINKFHGIKVEKILMPLFQQPGGLPNFIDLVRENQVCLENAVVDDPLLFSVKGMVRVRNLDFHKSVHIRYTLNSWKTYADVQASYVDNSCDGFSDKFSFIIYAHTLSVGQRLEFACRFQCKGIQYWDSNKGANYTFQCLPATNHSPVTPITRADDWGGVGFY